VCAFCGSTRNVEPHHLDGDERNTTPENLLWACRSCNVKAGLVLRELGIGRITRQFNPTSQGAQTLSQWVTAVLSLKGESDTMDVESALAMVRATPSSRRSDFAHEIWRRRRDHYGERGRS
jgi:hypothetical protein